MKRLTTVGLALMLTLGGIAFSQPSDRHALIIGGLGGSPDLTDKFQRYLFETKQGLIDNFDFATSNVRVLGEASIQDRPFVDGLSNAETIRSSFESLGQRMSANDQAYIILFGHGSFDGDVAKLNIPRQDLTDADFAEMVDALPGGRVVFVNTASASAPFIKSISAPNRIVLTATRVGSQRNETVFPTHFVSGLSGQESDLDRDGNVSVLELFRYAAESTDRHFESNTLLATENALLEDDGDAEGSRLEELESGTDGNLAATTYLRSRTAVLASVDPASREAVSGLLAGQEELERSIAEVKSRKGTMDADAYYSELETLFVRLALLADEIESETGR